MWSDARTVRWGVPQALTVCLLQGISVKQYEDALAADGVGQTGDLKAMAEFVLKANKNAVSLLLMLRKSFCQVCFQNRKRIPVQVESETKDFTF